MACWWSHKANVVDSNAPGVAKSAELEITMSAWTAVSVGRSGQMNVLKANLI